MAHGSARPAERRFPGDVALLLAVLLLGWGLALARLGERSLWADEGASAVQAENTDSLIAAIRLHKDYPLLHLVLEMGIVRLSRNEFALRLPSAMAATLALAVLYALGARLLSRAVGLVGSFLLAISPFAINYAQEARAYAFLELFACLSLLLLLMALGRRRWFWWAAYALASTLLLYTHFFGWFVVGAEVVFALIVLLYKTATDRQLDPRLPGLGLSLAAIAMLYLPLAPALSTLWQQHGPGKASLQGAGLYSFQLAPWFFKGMLTVFGGRATGWGLWLYGISLLLGFVSLAVHEKWHVLLLAVLWLAVPLVGLTAVSSQHFFDFRYLIFILPLFLLVTAEGVCWVASLLLRAARIPSRQAQPVLALGLACLLFLPANSPALKVYHRSEKENWRNIARFIRENLQPDEAIYVSPQFWANPLLFYQPSLEPYVVGGTSVNVKYLAQAAEQHAGLWVLRHVDPIGDPTGALTQWVTAQGFDLVIDGYACGWGIHVYYRRADDQAPAKRAELLRRAADFCPTDPRFQSPPE
jgi:4-amino-4-deoxy-L-arabinose transferase-like glycosyltransferase